MELTVTLSPTQLAFVQANERYVWLVGGAGEGKTYAGVIGMLYHASRCQLPTTRWALVRDTFVNIKRNTIPSIERAFPGLFTWKDDNHLGYAPGIRVDLFGMDDLQSLNSIQGAEYDGIWIEEPAPILSAGNVGMRHEVFLVCATRIRGGNTPKRLQITMNPADQDHWTSKERDRPLVNTKICRIKRGENPHLTEADRYAIAEAYKDRPDLYMRFVEGKESIIYSGLAITPEFNEDIHVAPKRLKPVPGVACLRMWDGGLNPACVVLQLTPMGHLHCLDAVQGEGMGMRQFLEAKVCRLLAREEYEASKVPSWRDIGDPTMMNREQSDSEHTAARVIYDVLGGALERGESRWEPRRDSLKDALSRMVNGQPFFLVSPHVTDGEPFNRVKAALQGGYCYRVGPGGHVLKEGPDKRSPHSHIGDALTHGLARLFTRRAPTTSHTLSRAQQMKRGLTYAIE